MTNIHFDDGPLIVDDSKLLLKGIVSYELKGFYRMRAVWTGYHWNLKYKEHWFSRWHFIKNKNSTTIKNFKTLSEATGYVREVFY